MRVEKALRIAIIPVVLVLLVLACWGTGCNPVDDLPDEPPVEHEVKDTFRFANGSVSIRSEYARNNVLHPCCGEGDWQCVKDTADFPIIRPYYAVTADNNEHIYEVLGNFAQDSVDFRDVAINQNGVYVQGSCDTIRDATIHYEDVCDLQVPNGYSCP